MQLNVSSRQVETGEGVKLNVDAVTQVKVACFPPNAEGMERTLDKGNLKLACQHFLGEKTKAVQESLTATMEGHQRQVLGTLTVEKIYKDREAFANTVKEGVLDDMKNMGYEIVSYVVTDVSDDNGYRGDRVHQTRPWVVSFLILTQTMPRSSATPPRASPCTRPSSARSSRNVKRKRTWPRRRNGKVVG